MKNRWAFLLIAVEIVFFVLTVPYFAIHVPHYTYCDDGMVSQEDFEKAHSYGGTRQGSLFAPAPTLLVVPDDPYVQAIVSTFDSESEWDKAMDIMNWIYVNIDYRTDNELYGCSEYWAVPSETLYYMKGDCEDLAILFCSMAVAMGLDAVLLDYPEHTAAGVYIDGTLYQCKMGFSYLSKNLRFDGDEPTIYEIGDDRFRFINEVPYRIGRWERSVIDIPIYF